MKNDNIRIKKKSFYFVYGALAIALTIGGVLLLALPFIAAASAVPCYLFGALLTLGGLGWYGYTLYQEIKKPDALVLTNKGFTNYLVGVKDGVYLDWTSVSSIKIFGRSDSPSLGLMVENPNTYLLKLTGKALDEARERLENGQPLIAIPQKSVALSVAELKALFSKMVRGALSWENYSTQGKKAELRKEEPAEKKEEIPVSVPEKEPQETKEDIVFDFLNEPENAEEEKEEAKEQTVGFDPVPPMASTAKIPTVSKKEPVPEKRPEPKNEPDDIFLLDLNDD